MNTVSLIGRLTKEPMVNTLSSGNTMAKFTIAVDRGKDATGKDRGADFPSIICFGNTAGAVGKYLGKGRLVGIIGRIQTGSYQDNNGNTIYTTDIVADRVEFLGGKEEPAPKQEEMPLGFASTDDDDIPF